MLTDLNSSELVQTEPQNRLRYCRPAKGRSLGARVSSLSGPVRTALRCLMNGANARSDSATLFQFLQSREEIGCNSEPAEQRLAWFMINSALLRSVWYRNADVLALRESVSWFFGEGSSFAESLLDAFDGAAIDEADYCLSRILVDSEFLDLIPYVLDPHGHVTRGEIERDAKASTRRDRKRDGGVFYTPSDVVEFMVMGLSDLSDQKTWLDPACGTGIFLREIARRFADHGNTEKSVFSLCRDNLYGLDISPLSTESCAFVLQMECVGELADTMGAPFSAWQAIAKNIRACDSTLIRTDDFAAPDLFVHGTNALNLTKLFPRTEGTFDCVVMNPPYSSTKVDDVRRECWESFRELSLGSPAHAVLAFVEMMWKLTKPGGVAAAVVPLSVGASTARQFKACRRAISKAGGRWEFLFFDREPHALFGEDIKTRNAIIFRTGSSQFSEIHTSQLLKWTSAIRASIFTKARTTRISADEISSFIPKFGTESERKLYEELKAGDHKSRVQFELVRSRLSDVVALDEERSIVIGSTAYNFLNVFPSSGLRDIPTLNLSESPVHAMVFGSRNERQMGLAILASSIAFWLWHVEGDGFHVTSDFLHRLPLWSLPFSKDARSELSKLGAQAWKEAQSTQLKSINGGRVTYSFHCPFESATIRKIDRLLLHRSDMCDQALFALQEFVHRTTRIDGTIRRRAA